MAKNYDLITVCDKCLRASCWQGIFLCDEAVDAGTIQIRKKELMAKGLESEDYLLSDEELAER